MCNLYLDHQLGRINRMLTGWVQYFSQGYPAQAYRQVNWYTRDRLTTHLCRRSQRPYKPPNGVTYYEQLARLGLTYLKTQPRRTL
ncbi:MAG: group II intron maturase-specific domain-containing protein [Phycisphaerales bacterium]